MNFHVKKNGSSEASHEPSCEEKGSSEASDEPSHESSLHLKGHMKLQMNLFPHMKVYVKVQKRLQVRVHEGRGPSSYFLPDTLPDTTTIYQCTGELHFSVDACIY